MPAAASGIIAAAGGNALRVATWRDVSVPLSSPPLHSATFSRIPPLYAGLAAQIVEYPLDDSFEAIIIAPSAAMGINKLVKALSTLPARWALWTGALRQRDVAVRLPSFRLETTTRYKETLRGLGAVPPGAAALDAPLTRWVHCAVSSRKESRRKGTRHGRCGHVRLSTCRVRKPCPQG